MATMSVRIKVDSKIPQLTESVRRKAQAAIAKAASDIEAQAKARAPEDTGLLKNSINTHREEPGGVGGQLRHFWVIESPVHYSVYQEFGTRKMAAQPYMVPAVEFVKPSFEMAMRSLVP